MPSLDGLSRLIGKHNPLAVWFQETFMEDTKNITAIINSMKLNVERLGVFPFLSMRIYPRV